MVKQTKPSQNLAIELGLKLASDLNLDEALLIQYDNSSRSSSDKQRVVGYAAIAIGQNSNNLSSELTSLARATIADYFQTGQINPPQKVKFDLFLTILLLLC